MGSRRKSESIARPYSTARVDGKKDVFGPDLGIPADRNTERIWSIYCLPADRPIEPRSIFVFDAEPRSRSRISKLGWNFSGRQSPARRPEAQRISDEHRNQHHGRPERHAGFLAGGHRRSSPATKSMARRLCTKNCRYTFIRAAALLIRQD